MKYELAKFSNIGPRRANEDAVAAVRFAPERIALAVADGLGGMGGGSRASQAAIEIFEAEAARGVASEEELYRIAHKIHSQIISEQKNSEAFRNMATTFTAAIVDGINLIGVHCGDTRLAVARANGITRLTDDHSEGMRLFKAGKLSKIEYMEYPRKHILDSALGSHKEPQIDTFNFQLQKFDRVVLSSDGLHQKVFLRELRILVVRHTEPSGFIHEVENLVKHRSPDDNFSLVALWCN